MTDRNVGPTRGKAAFFASRSRYFIMMILCTALNDSLVMRTK
jgi:hypothetical protein